MGTTALVLAIIGLLFCWSVAGGIILGIIAVILGFVGRARVKRGEATNGGVALAGIILGFLAIIAGVVFIALYVWVFSFFGGGDFVDCMNKVGNDSAAQQKCADEFQHHIETQFSVTLTQTPTP
jgi:hypothetical protein